MSKIEPVAWRVECRWVDRSKGGDWRKYADYGTLKAAESSQQVFANPGDIESRIVPLYTHAYIVSLQDEINDLREAGVGYSQQTVDAIRAERDALRRDNRKLLDQMRYARIHLYAATVQLSPSDDKIIADHVEQAYLRINDTIKEMESSDEQD